MLNTKELNDEELNKVNGGTERCHFKSGKEYVFEIGHYYLSPSKKYIIQITGYSEYYEDISAYRFPAKFYELDKSSSGFGFFYSREDDAPCEEITNF
ncbi:MAG: bacteriocin [Erysipelotrichaceae bacterium]|nr:bacteriocin [Erysipelotrichaceae bacterium]